MGKTIYSTLIAAMTVLVLFGCGEDREHKPLSKIDVMSKSLVDTNKEYLYVASTGQVSRTTSLGRPYFQDQEVIVKLKFEEQNLVAYTVDKEAQFRDNANNGKIVFKIPIEHLEYREREDAFGEGTNVEEENEFVDWTEAKFFKAKPEKFEFTAISTLPSEFGNIFGGSNCMTNKGQTELEFKVEQTGIDIVVRRDFTSSIFCESNVDDLNDLAWSEETHYSLVPLESVISKGYEAKHYSRDWERTFGFFDTTEKYLDSSNSTTQAQERYIMHRWNPEREFITYHLDPRLNKPENSVLKGATLKGFERLNAALEESGAKLRLKTVEGGSDFKPGDIRTSSIVLVEDPVGAGLLGYGPSVTNPRTGEIVQARTVMYPGIMRMLIRRAYDELIEISEREDAEPSTVEIQNIKNAFLSKSAPMDLGKWKPLKTELEQGVAESAEPSEDAVKGLIANGGLNEKSFFERTLLSVKGLFYQYEENSSGQKGFDINQTDLMDAYSRHNMFPAQLETFTDITDKVLKEKILNIGQKKPWDDLEESQRVTIVNLVMPFVWIPTLIHEVGHNLGLRHNFAGSEDKDNFYSIEELASKGVESELGSPYSSMMEYSKSEVTGLRVPGKYDVAALRYGYADKVELTDGSIVAAPEAKPEGLKVFEYCSDEGVALNPNCNRFDEGTNLVEIVDSIIDSYDKRYKTSYFRNGRSNFSRYGDLGNAARINSQFRSLRLAFERLTDIMIDFNLPMEEVKTIEWLNEYNEAAKKVSDFFIRVIAEPDYSCLIYREGEFNDVMRFIDLKNLTFDFTAKKCSDLSSKLSNGFTIEGELGKSYLSRRFSDNPNIYLDQIDVRGVWFHKVLAMKYLTRRTLRMFSFDENTLSYLDHPEIGNEVSNFIKEMAMGTVQSNVEVKLNDGTSFFADYQHDFAKGYSIQKPLLSYVNRYLGIPVKKNELVPVLLNVVKAGVSEGSETSSSREFKEGLTVRKDIPQDGNEGDYLPYKFMEETYVVSPRRNDLGMNIIRRVEFVNNVYPTYTREALIAIFEKMTSQGDNVPEFSEEEQVVANGGIEGLYKYLVGSMPSNEYYYNLLEAM
ncbi:MAG: zinc-dependent metalloprotease [Bdellovibrionales bacterium]